MSSCKVAEYRKNRKKLCFSRKHDVPQSFFAYTWYKHLLKWLPPGCYHPYPPRYHMEDATPLYMFWFRLFALIILPSYKLGTWLLDTTDLLWYLEHIISRQTHALVNEIVQHSSGHGLRKFIVYIVWARILYPNKPETSHYMHIAPLRFSRMCDKSGFMLIKSSDLIKLFQIYH